MLAASIRAVRKPEDYNHEDLIIISFADGYTAFALRAELAKLQNEYFIDMDDAVVVTKYDKGKVLQTSLTKDKDNELCQVVEGVA